jgi:hypothetical protein
MFVLRSFPGALATSIFAAVTGERQLLRRRTLMGVNAVNAGGSLPPAACCVYGWRIDEFRRVDWSNCYMIGLQRFESAEP